MKVQLKVRALISETIRSLKFWSQNLTIRYRKHLILCSRYSHKTHFKTLKIIICNNWNHNARHLSKWRDKFLFWISISYKVRGGLFILPIWEFRRSLENNEKSLKSCDSWILPHVWYETLRLLSLFDEWGNGSWRRGQKTLTALSNLSEETLIGSWIRCS